MGSSSYPFTAMNKLTSLFRLLSIFLVASLLLTPSPTRLANAQSPDEFSWTTPVNLSNSGLTSLPAMVSDQNGIVHVVWEDDTLGTMYSKLVDGAWSPPTAVRLPFSGFAPVFVNAGAYVHAFWIDERGSLAHSRVALTDSGWGNWERATVLAKIVEDFKVVFQPDKTFHLSYITSLEDERNQAGAYYLRSSDGGVSWANAKPIYLSRYFRDLNPDLVNVDIAATVQGDQQQVFTVFNNPAVSRVFMSRSLDGGETWDEPVVVDGPTEANPTSSPYNPVITTSGSQVQVLWLSNLQSGFACSQYYQVSNDNGATWGERTRMLAEFVGCPQDNSLLKVSDDLTLLQTTIRDDVYLVAWNGEAWSKAYLQSMLSEFSDPLTNESVTFRCRQSSIHAGTTLLFVGCDELGNRDTWITSRDIGDVESWFPTVTTWDDPMIVVDSDDEISSAQAIVDAQGMFHILWLQVDLAEDDNFQRSIHYVRFQDDTLTQPGRILDSPDKIVEDFSVAYDRNRDRLVVVWTTGTTGEIYYSWADISNATSTFEWSEPAVLLGTPKLAKSPNILATPDGTLYIAYAIPVNEERGIYLISSLDGGETWEPAVQVFGVTEPDWQAVDFPKLASTGDEILHTLWRRDRIYGTAGVVGLYYARSEDRGQTWSEPQAVSNDLINGAWIVDGAGEGVHRFWLTSAGAESSFYHDASMDQGANWRINDNLTGFGEIPGIASPFIDAVGRVNFAQAVVNSPGNLVINHQQDNGGRWTIQDSLLLGEVGIEEITSLSAQELSTGRLILAYTFNEIEPQAGEKPFRLYLAAQSKDLAQAIATAEARQPTPTPPTDAPAPTPDTIQTVETLEPTNSAVPPTPTNPLPTGSASEQTNAMDTTTGLVLSVGLAVLVVGLFFLFTRLRRH